MTSRSRFLLASILAINLAGAALVSAQGSLPVPPVKAGLWQTRSSQIDANGKEGPAPEVAALRQMPPAARAQMAEMMRARGIQLPDENGVMKACLSKESLDAGAWQQVATEAGCTTTYTTRSTSLWKWHTSCSTLKSESDGETAFSGSEGYTTKMTSTMVLNGTSTTTTRIVQGKWLGAACGDLKPLMPPTPRG